MKRHGILIKDHVHYTIVEYPVECRCVLLFVQLIVLPLDSILIMYNTLAYIDFFAKLVDELFSRSYMYRVIIIELQLHV